MIRGSHSEEMGKDFWGPQMLCIWGDNLKDKKFLALSSVFFLLFLVAMAIATLNQPISRFLRAKNVAPSPLRSFVVVLPQVGTVGTEGSGSNPTKIKISVYMRDVNGTSIPNRSVKISSDLDSVSFSPSDTQITNTLGMAQFFMTSTTVGKTQLSVVDTETNTSIVNIPTVEFTK